MRWKSLEVDATAAFSQSHIGSGLGVWLSVFFSASGCDVVSEPTGALGSAKGEFSEFVIPGVHPYTL